MQYRTISTFIAVIFSVSPAIAQQNPQSIAPGPLVPPAAQQPAAQTRTSTTVRPANYEKFSYFQQEESNSSTNSNDTIWKKKNTTSSGTTFGNASWGNANENGLTRSQWEFQLFLIRQELGNLRNSNNGGLTSQFGMVNSKSVFGQTYTNPEQTQLNAQRYARLLEDERFVLDRLAGIPVVAPRTQNTQPPSTTTTNETVLQQWVDVSKNRQP